MKKCLISMLVALMAICSVYGQKWAILPFAKVSHSFGQFNDYNISHPQFSPVFTRYEPLLNEEKEAREMSGGAGVALGTFVQRQIGKFFLESGLCANYVNFGLDNQSTSGHGEILTDAEGNVINIGHPIYPSQTLIQSNYDNSILYLGVPTNIGYQINPKLGVSLGANFQYLCMAEQWRTAKTMMGGLIFELQPNNEGKDGLNNWLISAQTAISYDVLGKMQLRLVAERNISQLYGRKSGFSYVSKDHLKGQFFQVGLQCLMKFGNHHSIAK